MSVRNLDSLFNPVHVAVVGAGGERTNSGTSSCATSSTPASRGSSTRSIPARVGRVASRPTRASRRPRPRPTSQSSALRAAPSRTSCASAARRESRRSPCCRPDFARPAPREQSSSGAWPRRRLASTGCGCSGPNCLGLIVPGLGLNASFAARDADRGPRRLRLAVGRARDFGDRLGARRGDRLLARRLARQHARRRPRRPDRLPRPGSAARARSSSTSRSSRTPRKFMSAARAFARSKPIVAYKAGGSPASAKAAVSHTGAMAGEDAVYDAAFRARRDRARGADRGRVRDAPSCWRASGRPAARGWRSSRTRAARA